MKWQGVFPAITTPFQEDLSLDLDFLRRHLEAMLAAGCTGFVPLGSLGECPAAVLRIEYGRWRCGCGRRRHGAGTLPAPRR